MKAFIAFLPALFLSQAFAGDVTGQSSPAVQSSSASQANTATHRYLIERTFPAGALEEERTNLTLKLADGPVALETFVFVEGALERVVEADEFDELSPGEMQHRIR